MEYNGNIDSKFTWIFLARLRGRQPSEALYAEAGAIASASCSPATDMRGSAEYKRHLADELTRRALRRAVARINESEG